MNSRRCRSSTPGSISQSVAALLAVLLVLCLPVIVHAVDVRLVEMSPEEIAELPMPDLLAKAKAEGTDGLSEEQRAAVRRVMLAHAPPPDAATSSRSSRGTARLIKAGIVVGIVLIAFLVRRWVGSRAG